MANPYVYRGVHRETQEVYIGYRAANPREAKEDLGIYRTSSPRVKSRFDEFNWEVVAEFEDPNEAYECEQKMIAEQWGVSKALSLNEHHRYGQKSWNSIGRTYKHAEETKEKIAKGRVGWRHTEAVKQRISRLKKGCPAAFKGRTHTEEANEANRQAHLGKRHTEETRVWMSARKVGNANPMYGKQQTEETKEIMKSRALAREDKTCPYCGVVMKPGNMAQHIARRHNGAVGENYGT